jgi:transcription factor IIIB subunit 2
MNLGEKTEAVADSAIKLIKRMKRDWMCQGRRPSSLCGAAILIAAAIHKVKDDSCSTTKICETVFVCD